MRETVEQVVVLGRENSSFSAPRASPAELVALGMVTAHTTLGGQAQLCCRSLAHACTCVCGQMHTGLLTCSHVKMLTFGGGRLIPVWLSPCANMHRSLTLSPVPLTCPCGQSRGRGLVGPQLGSVSAVCSAPQPGNIVTNKHTNRPMIHTEHHTQTPPAQVHTHVEMVVGTHLQTKISSCGSLGAGGGREG